MGVCMHMRVHVYMCCAHICRDQKWESYLLELEVFDRLVRRTLGTELQSFCLFVCFEIGFLCEKVLTVLELSVDQAGLKLTEIRLPLPPECWD